MLKLLFLPGDGIGPEVMREARRVVEWLGAHRGLACDIAEMAIGGASIDAHGVPLTDETIAAAKAADAVFLGAVGGPKWANIAHDKRPEAGLLGIRKALDLFANLRPAVIFDALSDASSLKPEIVRGLDLMIVRELTGGIYFGLPRGIEALSGGQRRGFNTQSYSTGEVERVARTAFELARGRRKAVCSVDKANVMESSIVWRETVTALHRAEYADIALSHMYVDNCAMQLCRAPKQFDVILTDNLFGDILSDEAAMLTGSIGMLPSASLGAETNGRRAALYEPIHGSAPDIAGKNIANPLAAILCVEMWLRLSVKNAALADQVGQAVARLLQSGARTADIAAKGQKTLSTSAMGDAVLRAMQA